MGAEMGPQAWAALEDRPLGIRSQPDECAQGSTDDMIAYLDTHVAIRLADGRGRIGRGASRLIQRAELLFSPMVLVEMEYLFEIGRLTWPAKDVLRKLEHE